jgi:hypothetical protein
MILISAPPAERMILSAPAESIILSAGSAKQQSTKSCSRKCGGNGSGRGNNGGGKLVAATKTAMMTGTKSIILSGNAKSIIFSLLPAESMIVSALPADATPNTGTAHQQCIMP